MSLGIGAFDPDIILYHLSDIRENLLEWYSIPSDADVLEIGSGCGALSGLLAKKAKTLTCIELSKKRSLINACKNKECDNIRIMVGNLEDIKFTQKYDYVTLIGVLVSHLVQKHKNNCSRCSQMLGRGGRRSGGYAN